MIDAIIVQALERRIGKAQLRYGPIASTHEGMGVALEEWHELIDAVRANDLAQVQSECLDLAAVLIRMAQDVFSIDTAKRSVK